MTRLNFIIFTGLGLAARALCEDGGAPDNTEMITLVHGIMASIAWVVLFPLGSILIRVLKTKNAWWIHASIQSLAVLVVTASAATGIILAERREELDEYHPIIGLVLFAVVFLQAVGGLLHHFRYGRYNRRATITYMHIWLGRILITLGIINGGLGLLLAEEDRKYNIAYGVVAALIWLAYVIVAVIYSPRKKQAKEMSEKY